MLTAKEYKIMALIRDGGMPKPTCKNLRTIAALIRKGYLVPSGATDIPELREGWAKHYEGMAKDIQGKGIAVILTLILSIIALVVALVNYFL